RSVCTGFREEECAFDYSGGNSRIAHCMPLSPPGASSWWSHDGECTPVHGSRCGWNCCHSFISGKRYRGSCEQTARYDREFVIGSEIMSLVISSSVIPELVTIPGGWFLMGSETGQDNERPVHRVFVDEFLLASYQVTNSQYAVFVQAQRYQPPPF